MTANKLTEALPSASVGDVPSTRMSMRDDSNVSADNGGEMR